MPSMTWLLESTSFSRGFLLRKIVGTGKAGGSTCHRLGKQPSLSFPAYLLPSCWGWRGNVIPKLPGPAVCKEL